MQPEGQLASAPGRFCPPHYRYSPEDIGRSPVIEAEVLYVIGGLYGNPFALAAILDMAAHEPRPVTLVFNGDFNWFNIDSAGFENINATVLKHVALRGNVETELAGEDAEAGCGCAYPANVSDAQVARSNLIEERLRETAKCFPAVRKQLGELAMYAVARVGGVRIGIVHGDAEALAGWGFGRSSLDDAARGEWLASSFARANVRAFACSHTCLPACRTLATEQGPGAVINNGAAGMPNFAGTGYGIITRIATSYSTGALYGTRLDGVCVEALPVAYDQAAWLAAFLKNWPAGSPAHISYLKRLVNGPEGSLADAAPVAAGSVRGEHGRDARMASA